MRIQTKLDEFAFPKSTRLNKSFFSKNEPAKEKRVFRRKNRPAMMDQINSQGWKIRRDEEKSNRTPCETRFVLRKNNNCLISTRLNKSFFSKNEPAKEKRVFRRKNRPAMMDQINSQGWKIRRDEEKSNRTPCETRFVLRKNNNCLI